MLQKQSLKIAKKEKMTERTNHRIDIVRNIYHYAEFYMGINKLLSCKGMD